MSTRVVAAFAVVAMLGVLLVAFGADGDGDEPEDAGPTPSVSVTTSPEAEDCFDLPELPATTPVPLCSLGVGFVIPEGWQATLLTGESLERLRDADLARPSFLDAAISVASTGALFYAAGVDEDDRVAELKLDVQDGADTRPEAVRALAQAVVDSGQVDDARVVEQEALDAVRVDYRVTLPSAETGEDIDSFGSQLFVPDGDRLWSFIVTSEDEATQDAVLTMLGASITFD